MPAIKVSRIKSSKRIVACIRRSRAYPPPTPPIEIYRNINVSYSRLLNVFQFEISKIGYHIFVCVDSPGTSLLAHRIEDGFGHKTKR